MNLTMIDFVKVSISGCTLTSLKQHLEFILEVNEKTGEKSKKEVAKYKGLTFTAISETSIELSGSLHKYKNGGKHNYDDFSYYDLQKVLADISGRFGIDLTNSVLHNLEFGVNISPPVPTQIIINSLVHYRNQQFYDKPVSKGRVKETKAQRCRIKVYDKFLQYSHILKSNAPIMRYELHFGKMHDLKHLGLIHLSDLLNRGKLMGLKGRLIKHWISILLFDDTLNNNYISELDRLRWRNYNYWNSLGKMARSRERKKFQNAVHLHSNRVQDQITQLIENKLNELMLPINRGHSLQRVTN